MPRRRSLRPAPALAPSAVGVLHRDALAPKPRSVLAAWRQRCLVGQAMALALWNAPAFAQNLITPDGRTQTSVAVSGATTTITTQTVSGGAGYNSFSRFEQAAGATVNMHLPQNTSALVNIVRDGPVVINGILNSYRNGQIGGHIYFSDSAGFTVGPSGVINTGQLTVNTPTREFLDQVIGRNGVVNEAMAARLRANDAPVSPDGVISIDGKINARRGVTLNGASVSVAGQITSNAAPVDVGERRRRHQAAFAQSVNTTGLRHGGAMVARRGGGIEIVAAGAVSISGSLSAKATAHRPAGSIAIRSGKSVAIAATARINAAGKASAAPAPNRPIVNTGDGGAVSIVSDGGITIARGAVIDMSGAQAAAAKGGSARIFAGTNLDVEAGAVFRGTAGASGDGGFLELSAKQTVTLGAIDVDLSARNGKAGLLFIDPTDIVIGTGGSANMITNGANVSLQATNSITILGDGIIDTRNFNRNANGGVLSAANPTLGNSGSITLEARQITVDGQLIAGVSAGSLYTAGDVTLTASASDARNSGKATAEATIDVSGVITGRDVTLTADATGLSSFINPGPGIALFAGLTNLSILTGLNGGYVASDITARVSVKNGASITATRDIVISATGTQEATLPAVSVTAVSPFAAAVTYADLKARVTAEVESGASLTIGRNLTVEAKNEATLGATALAASAGQTLAAFAVAVGTTDIETKAIVSSGASVTVSSLASNVRVSAINENAFSTSATAMSISGGMVGLSVAYSDTKASAEARLGASLGSSGGRIGNVTVEALSDNSKNATSSAVTLGQNLIIESLQIANAMEVLFAPLTSRLGSREIGKFGSTVTLAKSDLSAIASIAADAGGSAPTIYATKTAVVSDVRDFALRAAADAAISSNSKNPTAVNPEALVAMSAGVVYGDFRHTSRASIGADVTVDSNRIGVSATTEVPIANTWTDWAGFGETLSHLNGTFGVAGNILTSYASATSESSQLGLAGAVDYYKIANNTEAYVGPGATLRQNSGLGSWDIALGTGALQSFDKVVTIAASTKTETIDVAGNYGIFSGTGTNGGAGSAMGGAFADLQRESRTVAAVGAGVTITALELAVTAKTEDKIFALAPTSGKAAGDFAANGMVVLVGIDNHTLASISNQATVNVASIDVDARQFVSLFALTGAVTYGGANSVGVSVAALDTATVTRAYVGDNSADLSDNRLGGGYARGLITARSLDVEAVTDGRMTVASLAAAISDPNASKLSFFKGIAAQGKTDAAVLRSGAGSSISLTAAGSAAVATTTLGTSAWIDGAVVVGKDSGAVNTDVAATNATIADVASGSAALNLTGASSPLSGALSGAVSIGVFDNSTDARIAGTTITGAGDTSVQALAGGRQTVVGVSIAAARANSGAAAVSAAVGVITDSVLAQINNSAINGLSGASSGNDVVVNAYRATDIGIGGGAAYAGAQAGLGVALTYVSIADPSGRDAVAALITDTSLTAVDKLTVAARTSSRIVSSAIAGGGGPDSNGLAGAIVINEISPTTRAAVTDTVGAPSRIAMDGDVLVVADSGKDSALDAALASRLANTDPGQIDFTGRATNANDAANPVGASIIAIAGAVQAGKNNIGFSFLSNTISQSHIALIDNIDLTSSTGVTVRAQDGSLITAVAVGLGVASGQFAGVASVAQQTIDAVVSARISGGSIMSRDVAVQAQASSAIRGSAGSLGIGIGAAAVGLSIVESSIANDVSAEIDGAQIRASRDVALTAGSTATIDTIAIGIALSRNVGLAGSVANNSVATDVGAVITGADVIAGNNLGVFAANTDRITVSAGALGATAAAPGVAGGLSIVNNTIGGATSASISDSTVDARAGGAGALSYNAGQLVTAFDLSSANSPSAAQPSLAMSTRSIHGLGVVATSQQSILANAVTGGVAAFPITGAVAIVPISNVLGGSTSATIDSSLVDTRLTGADSTAVAIEAASHSYAATFITVGSIGGVAASGANANTVMERSTKAALTRSTTGATAPGYTGAGVTALDIAANASQSAASNVSGFALGLGGAAALGVVNSFDALTSASLDQGLVTAGRVGITADSRNGFYARTVVVAAGGVGVGGAFIVGTSRNATLATIGGGSGQTVLNLNGGLAVAAASRNAFTTLAAGGAAGGFAGVAGMVSFVDVENETRAGLYGVSATLRPGATQTVNGVTGAAGVSVVATETTSITPTTAAGANGSFGAGAAANIANLDSRVLADILNSTLVAPGAVSASATSDRTVNAQTITYGIGGSAGIGAAVALISVGTGTPSGAQGEINAGGNGTLSRINQLTTGNAELVLSSSGLTAYRSYRGAAGAAMSESDLRAAAQAEYNLLLANGSISGGALTLTSSGVAALRSAAATALGVANPSDAQVSAWATTRYTALTGGAVSYLLSDAGVGAYRNTVIATIPNASEDQIRSAANDAYARLLANGAVTNGVLTLNAAGIAAYRAEASVGLDHTATDAEVLNYAAQRYSFFNANRSRIVAPASQSATALLDSVGSATKATVTGGDVTSGSVAVTALSRTTTSNIASGVGAGGAAGVGAATAYTNIGDDVSASFAPTTATTGAISVTASSTDGVGSAARVEATAGAGALAVAAGAAIAKSTLSNQVTATLGGALATTGATTVSAVNSQTGRSDAFGATVAGGLALGVSLAKSAAASTVAAQYLAGSSFTGTGLSISASSAGAAYAAAVAGVGGLLAAGAGAEADAEDSTNVSATIGAGARANVGTGTIKVEATASPDAKAFAKGVAVSGGLAVGAAIANATVNPTVRAAIESNLSLPTAAQFTAGTLSVLATGSIFGATLDDAVELDDNTGDFTRGGMSASASAIAGSGSYYVSAVGTDSRARNTSSVAAEVGDYVRLSNGAVKIIATNATAQGATATGVTVAGTAAVGTVNAQADAQTHTNASTGSGVTMAASGAGSFTLTATGSDTQIVHAKAGSGGLYAGSGATGSTSNLGTVTASLGDNARISTGLVTIGASHTTSYASLVDSLQASALGASASLAKNGANVDVLTSIGAGGIIGASGPNTAGCYLPSCQQAISLTSENVFTQLSLGDSVQAAAGGGINGAGATARTEIEGTSRVALGDDVALAGGSSPTAAPGSILIQAWSDLTAKDTATLTTGGLLQGAGVSTRYKARLDNEVALGQRDALNSYGVINLGTYTTANVRANAYVNTYGLAGVGLADANVTITSNNDVIVGANSALLGLYDVNVTAGRDGAGQNTNSLLGNATALGYVRGLIAVPGADASTDLQNHAKVDIGSGATISSAQNVTLGAYDGLINARADGTGHGYQLYFIPVTAGSSSPGFSSTSTLVMNGAATAGIYNTQRIEIGCGANASVQCGPNEAPTVRFVSGAPVTAGYNTAFDAVAYVNANYDPTVAPTLISGVSSSPVKAVRLSQLYAAGGNIYVNGGTVQGNGTLTAKGGPSITVINRSNAYLILDGGAYIPETTGGQIVGSTGSLTRHTNPDATPIITIDNSYTGALDASGKGPGLLIAGDITNLAGVVSLNNTQGSFGFSGQRIDALQFNTTVPNGAVVVSSNGPNGMYNAGATPQAEYGSAIYYPGGGPGDILNVDEAVFAAANALAYGQGATNLNYFLYGKQDEGTTRNFSMQFYGNCIGYIGDAGYACTGGYDMGNNIRFMVIPTRQVYRESNPTAEGGGTKIYGSQVAIKATTININAAIEAGRVTDWQGTIGGVVGDILRNNRQSWLDDGYTTVSFASIFGGGWAAKNAVPISYDVVNNRLIMADVNASSGGGSVLLDGQIISTNTIGSIKVNGGFGNVSVNNQSGLDLVTSRINTGAAAGVNASVSKITIIDRLVTDGPNTTIYAYTPGSGIAVYKTMNGALPAQGATPYNFISGATAWYNPVAGTRYEWTQQALLQKVGLTEQTTQVRDLVSYWRYDSGTSSNPWVYVDAQSPSTNPGADWMYWWSRNAQPPSATGVSGRVTNNRNLVGVGMTQEITGGQLDFINNEAHYGGCNQRAINHCDRDFVAQPGAGQAIWNYQMVTRAFVQVTASVKADNPFGISFAGNASGVVNINSNSSVLLQGNIVNPSGTTTINASAGSITQAANVSILSNNLTLNSRDSIGTAGQAIQATLTSGAQLSAATGSGGINLDVTGSARVAALRADGNPNAYGDIRVRATGSLEAVASANANVVGRNITLASENGGIGSLTNLMKMRAVATQLPNGSYVDGVVNVSALGDIGIAQLAGDLRVGEIKSEAGDVRIDVNTGRLVSASGQTSAQALSAEQLSQVSRALKLTAADGADAAAQASIATFEAQVTQAYGLYSALIRNGGVDANGVFKLNDNAVALYQAFADAALGGSATVLQVKAYATERYNSYASAFKAAYGDSWATKARFNAATLESNFSFRTTNADAAAGIADRIAGDAAWTDRQLVSAINQSALQPASGVVGNGAALVVGHDVTLNIAGSIGSLAPDMQVSLDSIRSGSISDAQLAALSVATTPGTVKIMGRRQDGSLVEVADLNNVPAGVTLTRVDVKQTAPLFINATGAFSASAQGDVYVQATTNVQSSTTPRSAGATLTLGAITATGTVSLQAPQGIVVGTQADGTTPRNPVQIQTGGDLVLVAGGGGIGSATTPLTYQIGGRLVSASAAAGDAYLIANAGNAEIGRIFASGIASLTAHSGGIQGYLPGVSIAASSILLNTTGNVGSSAAALGLQVGANGEVSGQIGGYAWLSAPAIAGQSATPLRIGALSATSGVNVTADGEIRILRSLRSSSGGVAATGGKVVMAAGAIVAAAGRVGLASASDVLLGQVSSAWTAPAGAASIAITAAGSILSNGDAGALLDASQTGGVIDLLAGAGIGGASAALTFAAPILSASSLAGDIHLATSGATHVTSLQAHAGAARLVSGGDLIADTVTTAAGADLSTTNGALSLASLTAGASSTLSASGMVTLGAATTTVGDLSVVSTGANLSLASVDVAGSLTLIAATSLEATGALTSGGSARITAQNGTLTLASLTSGGAASLEATGVINLASATTRAGGFSATSSGAGITGGTIDAAGAASLTAAGPIAIATSLTSGDGASVTSSTGSVSVARLTSGASSTLSASGAVTIGDATTTAGDLTVTSTGANLSLTSVDVAGSLTLTAATSLEATGALTSGGSATITAQNGTLTLASVDAAGSLTLTAATSLEAAGAITTGGTATITAQNGALSLASLTAGGAAALEATGTISLASATTMAGSFSAVSSGAGITAGVIDAANAATLTAAGPVSVTTSLTSGATANVTTTVGSLNLASLTAGASSTLSASRTVTLGAATTTAGDLTVTSTGANLLVASIDVAGSLTLTAATSIAATGAIVTGGAATLTAQNGALTLASLTAGGAAALEATGAISLASATTMAGSFSAVSSGAGITAGVIDAADAATLAAAGPVSVTTSLTAGNEANVTTTAGPLTIASLTAGASSTLSAPGTMTLGAATTTAGDLTVTSTGANLLVASLDVAGSLTLTAATSLEATGAIVAGGTATITAQNGALTLASLMAGGAAALEATGAISLASATTMSGAFSAVSSGAGITVGVIDAADAATLRATGPVSVTTSLTAGDAANVTTTAGSLTIASLTAGASSILSASRTVMLGAAMTTAGDLSITSTGANLSLASVDVAGSLTLTAATSLEAAGAIVTGGTATITAQNGSLTLASLLAGGAAALEATGAISLASATTTAGSFSAVSSGAGITVGVIDAAGSFSLTAADSIDIGSFAAGGDSMIRAGGQLRLASGDVRDGALSMAGASVDATALMVGKALDLVASGPVVLGSVETGTDLSIRSFAGTISVSDATAGRAASIDAAGALTLGAVAAGSGGVSALSRNAGITVDDMRSSGDVALAAHGPISVGALVARDAKVSATTGSLAIATLNATSSAALRSGSTLTVDRLASGAASDIEGLGGVTIGALSAGGDVRLVSTGASLNFSTVNSSGSAALSAGDSIGGGTVAAQDALTLQAGRSGQGSIAIDHGAARRLVASAPDEIRFDRFNAGESIVIMGTRIAANIIHNARGDLPLALDIVGFRARSADRVDMTVEAQRFRAGRFDAIDARLTTTADQLSIVEAFIPGALTLKTPRMMVFANNRSLTPNYAYDAQLYSMGRPFYLDVNGARLATSAYIVRFDSDIVDVPPTVGSLTRDSARLSTLLTGGIPGDIGGGPVVGANGGWRGVWGGGLSWSSDIFERSRGFVSPAAPGKPPVNLDDAEDRP